LHAVVITPLASDIVVAAPFSSERNQIREIEDARRKRLEQEPETGPHAMVRHLARVVGVGIETADMLVHEVLSLAATVES
jgi:hypothetical protein